MKGLIIDAQNAGASGDMFLGALVALLHNDDKDIVAADKKRSVFLKDIAQKVITAGGLSGKAKINVGLQRTNQFALEGIQLKITIEEPHRHLKIPQAMELLEELFKLVNLSEKAKLFSTTAFNILFEAEAAAHGEALDEVHLHEAGSLDTFLDVVGSAYLLEKLGLFEAKIFVLPIALGSGTITFSHGTLPVPAPAVAEIVKKYKLPVHMGNLRSELLTPTGAILIASLMKVTNAQIVAKSPFMIIEAMGVGFGTKEFEKTPNGLRLFAGKTIDDGYPKEEIAIIETNLDDCSGETIGFLSQRLLDLGAKDVFLTPIYMKKGRPGTMISVLCPAVDVELYASEIMNQTSTIGVRIIHSSKIMLRREIQEFKVTIAKKDYTVRGKIAFNKVGEIAHFKPEFDDVKLITEQTNLTINEVVSIIRSKITSDLKKKKT